MKSLLVAIHRNISITIHNLLGLPNNASLVNKLTKPFNYESANSNPGNEKISLSGPRLGLTAGTGELYQRMTDKKSDGGYDALPVMTQFGYQFETQYLNEGNFQALVEFIPMITGVDQGYFIPSFTILNGFRNNLNGWEFAFGPSFGFTRKAMGYYDENKKWHLQFEWEKDSSGTYKSNPNEIIKRSDSRGTPSFTSGFVIAVGKTFKSGKLNIPVNAYIIPDKTGCRFGASFGFNAKNKK
jgi:hypothetical protein